MIIKKLLKNTMNKYLVQVVIMFDVKIYKFSLDSTTYLLMIFNVNKLYKEVKYIKIKIKICLMSLYLNKDLANKWTFMTFLKLLKKYLKNLKKTMETFKH